MPATTQLSTNHLAPVINLRLPYPPSVNRLWRSGRGKNKIGKAWVYPSAEYKEWMTEAHISWLQQKSKLPVKSISGHYVLTIEAYPPDKRHRDIGNLEKVVSDFLETMGVVSNDRLAKRIILEWGDDNPTIPCIWIALKPYP